MCVREREMAYLASLLFLAMAGGLGLCDAFAIGRIFGSLHHTAAQPKVVAALAKVGHPVYTFFEDEVRGVWRACLN